jgi:MEMO1 family protein
MVSYGVNRTIREAIVAGIFYPEDPGELSDAIDTAIGAAGVDNRRQTDERTVGILAPHSAFDFSGRIQAAAWASAIGNSIDRVVILAPYRTPGASLAYLPQSECFQTPLGDIEVDIHMCEELESYCTLFSTNDIPHLEDHSIEIQLPFMRHLFPSAMLVPIFISGDAAVAGCMARSLDLALGTKIDRTLIVASSNLASSLSVDDARLNSDTLLGLVATNDWRGVAAHRNILGAAAIASAMAVSTISGARYDLLARLDSHRQNARISARVVEYAAIAWYSGGTR